MKQNAEDAKFPAEQYLPEMSAELQSQFLFQYQIDRCFGIVHCFEQVLLPSAEKRYTESRQGIKYIPGGI